MRRLFAMAALAALAVPAAAHAAPGDLDGSFAGDGLQENQEFGAAQAIAAGSDGSVVFGAVDHSRSGFALHRYSSSGGPTWTTPLLGPVTAIERVPGGFVAGGSNGQAVDFVLTRVAGADGRPDPSFGGPGSPPGTVVTPFNPDEGRLTDLSVAGDGSIAAAGIGERPDGGHVAVVRYRSDGSLDPGFNGGSPWTLAAGGGFGTEVSVLALDDGSTVLAGAGPAPDGSGTGDALVLKLDPTGNLDTGFSDDGWITIDVAGRDDARSLALQPDGSIVVGFEACAFGLHTSCDPAVARLTPDGALDPSFGAGGVVVDVAGFEVAHGGGGGRMLVAGSTQKQPFFQRDFALARLLPNGSPDPAFRGGAAATADFGLTEDIALALDVGPDGRPVVAGGVGSDGHGIARFVVADGPPDADADGRLDNADRCPRRFSRHKTGCPKVARKLKLRKAKGRLEVRLKADLGPCIARQRVKLLRLKGKRARVVVRARTSRKGKAKVKARLKRGRYRATAKQKLVPELARCAKARSRVVRAR